MAKRVKSDRQIVKIDSWKSVDYLVMRIGALRMDIENAEASAQKKIDAIKADLADTVKTAQESIEMYVESMKVWCEINRDDFSGQQSRKLNHGTLGWRKSTLISLAKDTIERIKAAFGKRAGAYLHIKEAANKEALSDLTDEELKSVGARRRHKEVFFVEPDKIEAADHAA